MKKSLIYSTVIALFLLLLFPINLVMASNETIRNDSTGIPDKYLYREILFQLDKNSSDTFTREEAERVYCLDTVDYSGKNKISSLKGIDILKNLKILEIHENNLSKLEGVDKLANLETLKIGKGNLKNVNEIEKLTNLTELSVEGNKIEDWKAIKGLVKLNHLNVCDCGLTDSNLKEITGSLTNLTELKISQNKLNDLDSISKLYKLKVLYANNCTLKTLAGGRTLINLEELYLANNKLDNISEIDKMTNLRCLDLSNNNIKKLPNLKKHTKLSLEYTNFEKNKISEEIFKKSLPSHILKCKWWVRNQVILQKLKKKLKITKINKIKSTSKQIKGVTEKNATLILRTLKGKKIKTIKADKKGKFTFKKLKLKKYKGKRLKITAYLKYDDRINGESRKVAVRTIKFKVR